MFFFCYVTINRMARTKWILLKVISTKLTICNKADKNTCNNRTSGHVKKVNTHLNLNLAGLSFEGLVEAQKYR